MLRTVDRLDSQSLFTYRESLVIYSKIIIVIFDMQHKLRYNNKIIFFIAYNMVYIF